MSKLIPNIKPLRNKDLEQISKDWWNNIHKGISVLDWSDEIKAVSRPFEVVDLSKEVIDVLLSDKYPVENKEVFYKAMEGVKTPIKYPNFFCKTITRSPKDSKPDLKFNSFSDVIDSLMGSMRTFEDLCLLSRIPSKAKLIFKEWIPIEKEKEFRVFVKDNKLNGISQYHYSEKYDWILQNSLELATGIREFVNKKIIPFVSVDNYVLDILVHDNKEKGLGLSYELIEINPYGLSDPCLYNSYENLKDSFTFI